jgi:protein-tyrosine phosphatase
MYFSDGASPPLEIIDQWIELISEIFDKVKPGTEPPCVAIHCVAGLGRLQKSFH